MINLTRSVYYTHICSPVLTQHRLQEKWKNYFWKNKKRWLYFQTKFQEIPDTLKYNLLKIPAFTEKWSRKRCACLNCLPRSFFCPRWSPDFHLPSGNYHIYFQLLSNKWLKLEYPQNFKKRLFFERFGFWEKWII